MCSCVNVVVVAVLCLVGSLGMMPPAVVSNVQQFTYRMYENLALRGAVNYTLSNVSAKECCIRCLSEGQCNSVSFNPSSGDCEVNHYGKLNFDGIVYEERSGWRLYEREPCGLGFKSGAHCHHVIPTATRWADAVTFCTQLGESLVEVRNEQEKDDLVTDVVATGYTDLAFVWIGLNTKTNLWPSGYEANYTFWTDGEPNGPTADCTMFYMNWSDNSTWYDYPCGTFASYVCERRYD